MLFSYIVSGCSSAISVGIGAFCPVSCTSRHLVRIYRHTLLTVSVLIDNAVLSLLLIIMLCSPGITLWSTISINLGIPYWSISIALNVIITGCIVTRLLYMRRQVRRANAGGGSEYLSVTSMSVESASLYSINGIIFIVSYGINSPIQNLALPVLGQTQVCP
jgi:hypothetical protein